MFDSRKIRERVVCHDNAIKTADKNILHIIFLHIIIYRLQIDENQAYFCSNIGTELRSELLFSYFIFVSPFPLSPAEEITPHDPLISTVAIVYYCCTENCLTIYCFESCSYQMHCS